MFLMEITIDIEVLGYIFFLVVCFGLGYWLSRYF